MKTKQYFLSLIFLGFVACESITHEKQISTIKISIEKLADQLGDKNGATTLEELNFINDFFDNSKQMWVITNCLCSDCKIILGNDVLSHFCTQGIAYNSEDDLRDTNEGISIKTPFIGIALIERKINLEITKIYRSPGANFSSSSWDEIEIIN